MSDPHVTDKRPSTEGQLVLLKMLEEELHSMGVKDVDFDPNGYLIARIPSTLSEGTQAPTIGFMAHVDVADDVQGNGVTPQVIESYDGLDITLAKEGVILADENPLLSQYKGTTLIVTDGTTLLGGDDKAGVAIMMETIREMMKEDAPSHGEVEFIFTTDEETGKGMDAFDVSKLNAHCCYTLDGGERGVIEAQCFNAATVVVDFYGIPYHLGAARGKMVSSIAMALSYLSALPRTESPEATDGLYGYYAAEEIQGTSAHTQVTIYVRDFELMHLQRRIDTLRSLAEMTEQLFLGGKVEMSSEIVYKNMYEAIQKDPRIMDAIWESVKKMGITLREDSIRGGTDGARLAEMGIAAPNLYTGAHNLHSLHEWLAVETMVESAHLVKHIIAYWAKESL